MLYKYDHSDMYHGESMVANLRCSGKLDPLVRTLEMMSEIEIWGSCQHTSASQTTQRDFHSQPWWNDRSQTCSPAGTIRKANNIYEVTVCSL